MIEGFIRYKSEWAGKRVVRVNPAYTSQRCSACRHVEESNRKGEALKCRSCGHEDNAGINAGKNVRAAAIAILKTEIQALEKEPGERAEFAPVRRRRQSLQWSD